MQQDLISVVVPVYKVESVLGDCLDSICNQTYKNLEIILVDDGSPDNCGRICDEYEKKDHRIRVIHQKNQGLSAARNNGLEQSSGEYIAFVDSDDILHKEFYNLMMQALKYTGADMSVCNMMKIERKDIQKKFLYQKIENPRAKIISPKEACSWFYQEKYRDSTALAAVNKLYKKTLFGTSIRYPYGKLHEDIATTYKLFCSSEKIAYVDLKLYCYIITPGSITNSSFGLKNLYALDAYREMRDYFKKDEEFFIENHVEKWFLLHLLDHYVKVKNNCPDEKRTAYELLKEFRRDYRKYRLSMELSIKERLRFEIVYYMPKCWFYSIHLRKR